jgi:ribosome-associated translation inhibitor RaiA
MKVPLQVVFEHIAHVDYIEERVRQEVEKLEQFYDHIMSARVVIARPQHTHHKGDTYSVRLHLTVPGAEDIAVSRDLAVTGRHEDVQVTITDAFDAARRQLQDLVRKRQGHVKAHEMPPHGIIPFARNRARSRIHCICRRARDLFSSQQCGRRQIRQSRGRAGSAIFRGSRRQGTAGNNCAPGWQTPP